MTETNVNPNKKTILLVDDDLDFLLQQQTHLTAMGYEVVTAESAGEAETLLADENFTPDAAVLDLMMEYDDAGFVLCHHLKRRNPNTPVILCTAVASESSIVFDVSTDEERSWIKADVLLEKPVRFEQLQFELTRLLEE
jgi:CheY-like chemotaxis protein